MSWERGVAVRMSSDGSTMFVASSYDTLLLYSSRGELVEIGDCIEFIGTHLQGSENSICRRMVDRYRKCDKFVETEVTKNGCLLILEILEILEPTATTEYAIFRTEFLERVLDNGNYPLTHRETLSSLRQRGMKVVCQRAADKENNESRWFAIGLKKSLNSGRIDRNPVSEVRPNIRNDRIRLRGLVCTAGAYRDGKDEIYIWIPYRDKPDIFFPPNLRKNYDRRDFYGRWLAFTIDAANEHRLDEDSDYQFINDEFPTRIRDGHCEVNVKCWFDPSTFRDSRNYILESDACGLIVDANSILYRYDRTNAKFAENLWVFNRLYENDPKIKWILSSDQECWNRENLTRNRSDDGSFSNRKPMRYDDEYETDRRSHYERNMGSNRNDRSETFQKREDIARDTHSKRFDREGSSRDSQNTYMMLDEKPPVSRRNREAGSYRSESPKGSFSASSGNRQEKSVTTSTDPKTIELLKLQARYDYMIAHDLQVPDSFLKKLEDVLKEMNADGTEDNKPRRSVDKTPNEDTRSETSSFKNRKEIARIEILEEELARYKKVLTLFRDMLSDGGVCRAMRNFDPVATDEIFQKIFHP